MIRQNPKEATFLLNSWKEIAQYLDRGVRTVQRWERDLHLPVHRIGNGARSPVYANITELRFWMNTSEAGRQQLQKNGHVGQLALVPPRESKPIEDSRRLLLQARDLAQKISEASIRQRRQAEDLYARLVQVQERIK
jgi:hypothetical protein